MWSSVKKVILGLVVVIVLLIGGYAIFFYLEANREIEPHFAGQCEIVELDGSSEDIQVDRERGQVCAADRGARVCLPPPGRAPRACMLCGVTAGSRVQCV